MINGLDKNEYHLSNCDLLKLTELNNQPGGSSPDMQRSTLRYKC